MSTTLATVDYLPSGERTLDEWAALINGELEKSVRCIIAAGRHLAEALESLPHGSKAGLWERIPISQAEGAKLIRIADDPRIANYSALNNLPTAYTTLYELTQLDDATFHGAHEHGLLTPDLKAVEVKQWRKQPNTTDATAIGLDGVYTTIVGDNADLIANVSRLYLHDGETVLDATWGHGCFWSKIDTRRYDFHRGDIRNTVPPMNFTSLPFTDASVDVMVLDPPYQHGQHPQFDKNYRTASCGDIDDVMAKFYRPGMVEAWRVLRPGGRLMVKCQSEVSSSHRQRWTVWELKGVAEQLGFYAKDQFTMVRKIPPYIKAQRQYHAKRNESVLWVFEKRRQRRRLKAEKVTGMA